MHSPPPLYTYMYVLPFSGYNLHIVNRSYSISPFIRLAVTFSSEMLEVDGIGALPVGPNAYIKLPIHKHVKATQRHAHLSEIETYSSRVAGTEMPMKRERFERHHRPGNGWRSAYHPKVLDYRTADELGLPLEQLEEQQSPRTQAAKQYAEQVVDFMVVEGAELLREREGQREPPSHLLTEGKSVFGEIKPVNRQLETQWAFYRINVPDREVPVGLEVTVTAVQGDPDVYVCNRNTFPKQNPHEHTWKSQQTGDDVIYIPPHDPLFFPGLFYIGVWSMKESQYTRPAAHSRLHPPYPLASDQSPFDRLHSPPRPWHRYEVQADFIEQKVRVRKPMTSEGNGIREVRAHIEAADTRRRFCRNGVGFMEQLQSPRSLHGSACALRTFYRGASASCHPHLSGRPRSPASCHPHLSSTPAFHTCLPHLPGPAARRPARAHTPGARPTRPARTPPAQEPASAA